MHTGVPIYITLTVWVIFQLVFSTHSLLVSPNYEITRCHVIRPQGCVAHKSLGISVDVLLVHL